MMAGDAEPAGVIEALAARGLHIAVAESLTGGMVVAALVDVAGASRVLRGGAVTYATDTKASVLGVDKALLDTAGPIDPEVARQMALGAARVFGADVAISTTGVAGPDDQDGHRVGEVYLGLAYPEGSATGAIARRLSLSGSREQIRRATVTAALELLATFLATGLAEVDGNKPGHRRVVNP